VNRTFPTNKECAWHFVIFSVRSCIRRVYTECSSNLIAEVFSLPDVTLFLPTFRRGV